MTRSVVDCGVVLHLASEGIVGPGSSPSSWGGPRPTTPEYLALTQLQADAFVTLDAELARRVEGVVPTATIEALRTA
jgi:hypothetical protein